MTTTTEQFEVYTAEHIGTRYDNGILAELLDTYDHVHYGIFEGCGYMICSYLLSEHRNHDGYGYRLAIL